LYEKGDSRESYKRKLMAQEKKKWEFPLNFSPLARDFFEKLCAFKSAIRYNAKQALKHPWITGDENAELPQNLRDNIKRFNAEMRLRKVIQTMMFSSVII